MIYNLDLSKLHKKKPLLQLISEDQFNL